MSCLSILLGILSDPSTVILRRSYHRHSPIRAIYTPNLGVASPYLSTPRLRFNAVAPQQKNHPPATIDPLSAHPQPCERGCGSPSVPLLSGCSFAWLHISVLLITWAAWTHCTRAAISEWWCRSMRPEETTPRRSRNEIQFDDCLLGDSHRLLCPIEVAWGPPRPGTAKVVAMQHVGTRLFDTSLAQLLRITG